MALKSLKSLKKLVFLSILSAILLILAHPISLANNPVLNQSSGTVVSVEAIAQGVTVRILTHPGGGSGVIIAKQGDSYTLLTCNHVVDLSERYSVLTSDGKVHRASRQVIPYLNGIDLALVKFKSSISYPVVQFSPLTNLKQVTLEQPIYASGFPNYQENTAYKGEATFDWGIRAYRLTRGKVEMILSDKTLIGGYQIGYTNDIQLGMSGGPVLDQQGQLIGINGWSKYPLQGSAVFGFSDGSSPSQMLFERMETLSWAIPVSTVRQKIKI